jgi:hypothetical protein
MSHFDNTWIESVKVAEDNLAARRIEHNDAAGVFGRLLLTNTKNSCGVEPTMSRQPRSPSRSGWLPQLLERSTSHIEFGSRR